MSNPGRTILLVEDDAILALDEARQLKERGYRVEWANRGEQAIAMADARPDKFDLILMDIDLGSGLDGAQTALRILKEHDIPVVFLSSHTEPEIVEKTERITSYGYVVKDSGITVLDASIKMAFKLYHAQQERRRAEMNSRQYARYLEALLEIGRTFTSFPDLDSLLPVIVEQAVRLAGLDSGAIYLLEDGALYLGGTTPPLESGLDPEIRKAALEDHPHIREAIISGRPVYLSDAAGESLSPAERAVCEARGLRSLLYLPLGSESRTVGVLILGTTGAVRSFSKGEIDMFCALAGQVALAVENTRSRLAAEMYHVREFALESSMSAVGLSDMNGKIIYANDAYLKLWGYERKEDVLGRSITEFSVSEDQVRDVAASLKAGRPYIGEWLSRRMDGSEFNVQLSANLVRAPDGRPLCMMASFIDITARKKAESALREMSEMFRLFMEHNPIYVFIKDAGIRPVYLSRNYERMLGRPLSEILGRTMDELFPSDLSKKMIADDRRILREGKPVGDIIEVMEGRTYSTLKFPISIDGVPKYLAGYTVDITAQVQAAEALRENEKRYRLLAENMKDVVWILDPETMRFAYVSPSVFELRGFTPEEVVSRPASESLTPEFASLMASQIQDRIARFLADPTGDHADRHEIPQPRKDGSIVWTEVVTRFFREEPAGRLMVHGVTRDLTERKRAEEALRLSEERFRQIAESLTDFIWETDATGLYTYASSAVERILGYRPEDLVGRTRFYDLFPPDIRESKKAAALAVFSRQEAFREFENTNVRKDGRIVILETSGFPVLDATGVLLGYRGADRDVTERIREAETLRQLVRQKETLMRELQHRVKNSLAVVSGLLSIEMNSLPDEHAKSVFADTRSRIHSVASLYERLYLSLEIDTVDLRAHVLAIAKEMLGTFAAPRLRLETRLEEVRLDTRRAIPVGLILNELLMNALKYAYPSGAGGEIRVGLEKTDDFVTLTVADDGVGLSPGFDPISSGGIGMSLVRMMADQIDGTIEVTSRPGTRVSVRFKF